MTRIESQSSRDSLLQLPSARELSEAFRDWIREKGLFWATSATAHFLVLSIVMAVCGAMYVAPKLERSAPEMESVNVDTSVPDVENFDVGDTPLDPTELNTETLMLDAPTVTEQINTTPDEAFVEAGGGASTASAANALGMDLDLKAIGPGVKLKGGGGLGGADSDGKGAGAGDKNSGFGGRGAGVRQAMLGSGGTRQSERAVAAALNWLARHQGPEGSWSLSDYTVKCKDASCTGTGKGKQEAAATAMALLPFLAAGQTHLTKGPYQQNIRAGLYWLEQHQKDDGDLSAGGSPPMYSHGLAAIAMCEAYGLSHDKNFGAAAQKAVYFIEKNQYPSDGGWRYSPNKPPGDTSVVGWQVMALKSAHMAGLNVQTSVLEGAKRFLKTVGNGAGQFSYIPGNGPSPSMSAVGMLCSQYLGAQRDDPMMKSGQAYLMRMMPNPNSPNLYYWYYGTQVMHNLPGPEWDTWNRAMRRILIESQNNTKTCAAGSWDPDKDHWGKEAGGRIFMTSLSCLTLEVYYRYLPLYKLDGADGGEKK